MKQKQSIILILMLVPFLCGFLNVAIVDIQTAVLEKDYAKAEKLARKFISQNPSKQQSDEAQYYLGLSLIHQGQYSDAREVFRQLIKYRPTASLHDRAYLGIVDAHNIEEHYRDAIDTAKKLLNKSPRSEYKSLIYLKLARSNLKLANWRTARNYLKKIVNEFPDSLERPLAKQLLEEKQYFAVQVGSFLEQKRAEEIIFELKKQGEYAYIVETTDKTGRKFYRVRVGQLSRLNDAKKLLVKLSTLGYPTQIYP